MPILRIKRFLQDPGLCTIAAAAEVCNFYDKTVTYEMVKEIADNDGSGLCTSELAILLNKLGFQKLTIVSSDITQLDFTWKDLSKKDMVAKLKESVRKNKDKDYREVNRMYAEILSDETKDNNLVIDHSFGKYIRQSIDDGKPVLASFNWTMFFQWTKWNNGKDDPINGDSEEHEVVICGYDEKGVRIVDSHHEMYKGKLKKFKNGRYRMSWETLMTVMGYGDLIIPEGFLQQKLEIK